MTKSPLTIALALMLFIFGVALILLVNLSLTRGDIAPDDSKALYGGRVENGYTAAGFLVSYANNGSATFCGFALLTPTIGISAAHCFDHGTEHYAGLGQFVSDKNSLVLIKSYSQLPGWDREHSTFDFAVFTLSKPLFPPDSVLAIPADAQRSCNYRVVAYGRTEQDSKSVSSNRPRKSALLCIETLSQTLITLKGQDGGICLGDSGSPIFEENTNKVVGVISSIVAGGDGTDPCYIGNVAFAVRADANEPFVLAQGDIVKADLAQVQVFAASGNSNTTSSFIDQILSAVRSIQSPQILIVAGLTLIIGSIAFLVAQLRKQT